MSATLIPTCPCRTNFCLYTVELWQAYNYFSIYSNDPYIVASPLPRTLRAYYGILLVSLSWILRGAVLVTLLVDAVGTVSNAVGVYRIAIRHFGDFNVFLEHGLELPIYVITAALSGLICQAYLIWRFYRLSKSTWLAGLLLSLATAAVSGAHVASRVVHTATELSDYV